MVEVGAIADCHFGLFFIIAHSLEVFLLKTNLEWMKDRLATKSKGAVAGSNSSEK